MRQLISQQQNTYNWDFVFLGAHIDAVDGCSDLGFASGKSLTYSASSAGVIGAWSTMSGYQARRRARPAAAASDVTCDDADRRRARGEG